MNIYSFTYIFKGKERTKRFAATDLQEAIEKTAIYMEGLDDSLNLFDCETWEDIQDKCEQYNISNLNEEFE